MAEARPKSRAAAGPARSGVQPLEQPVGRRGAPAGVGVVDDVVVHEGGGVEELERGGGRDDREQVASALRLERVEAPAGDRLPAPVAEQGPEALAAAEKPP